MIHFPRCLYNIHAPAFATASSDQFTSKEIYQSLGSSLTIQFCWQWISIVYTFILIMINILISKKQNQLFLINYFQNWYQQYRINNTKISTYEIIWPNLPLHEGVITISEGTNSPMQPPVLFPVQTTTAFTLGLREHRQSETTTFIFQAFRSNKTSLWRLLLESRHHIFDD